MTSRARVPLALIFAATLLGSAASIRAEASKPELSTWALVLSGGIARGFAHAGVIRALEEAGARPDLVVGSSMGGLVGAMYSAGFTPDSMRAVFRRMPWESLLGSNQDFGWRTLWPRSWVELVSGGTQKLSVPAAFFDNTLINQTLVDVFLDAEARAQGDFDRLPIPFRAVGTDIRTGRWVMLDHGSLARACRITVGLPLMFPPVAEGEALLVDGGMSSNLPISPARAAGAERVLAVDVALPYPHLEENSSGIMVFLQLWDVLNKRGQSDTISAAAGDTLIWLRIPNAGAADFAGGPKIMDEAYDEAGAAVRSWVHRSGLDRAPRQLATPSPLLPPLASGIEFHGRGPVVRGRAALRELGHLPVGPFSADQLRPGLKRLSQSGLFESAWPSFRTRGDSTVLGFEVRERPMLEIGPAFTLGNDEGWRVHVGMSYRPTGLPLPALVKVGAAWRELGGTVHGRFEPRALEYGGSGWFASGRFHDMDTRIFDHGAEAVSANTHRFEALAGRQASVGRAPSLRLGAGYGSTRGSAAWDGVLIALRTQSWGADERLLDAEWGTGAEGYARGVAVFEGGVRRGGFKFTPGVRIGLTDGTPSADALVGLGGPHSLSGLHHDEWLGRRAYAGAIEAAFEPSRQARFYFESQVGKVEDAVSGREFGNDAIVGYGVGAEASLPIGPLRVEYGWNTANRDRVDIILGTSF
jgi:predicted acylesterase/phospholipase RssA